MKLHLYNSYKRENESFKPIKDGYVGLYTCGPTVYDYAHIGNFRTFIFEDLLKRWLVHLGYNVKHIMNITDIDDKTIKKANEHNRVTSIYILYFFKSSSFNETQAITIVTLDVIKRAVLRAAIGTLK